MKRSILQAIVGLAVLRAGLLPAQTHKVEKPQQVVRAVGVYEWTGELGKPAASRLIPVSLAIEGRIEDAGVYMARPIPFALLPGNLYELEQGGLPKGSLELSFARHLQTTDSAYEDGWFGYGSFHPPTASATKKQPVLRAARTTGVITTSKDDGRPHFAGKSDSGKADAKSGTDNSGEASAQASKPDATTGDSDRPHFSNRSGGGKGADKSGSADADQKQASDDSSANKTDTGSKSAGSDRASTADADRPTMRRRSSDASAASPARDKKSDTEASTPADDPDRPTMKRRNSDTSAASSDGDKKSDTEASTPADDPDRPTLKKRSPEEMKKDRRRDEAATVTGIGSLNDDPDRPNLHRGKPASAMTETDLPKLTGLPKDLHQMVAVSDAVTREPHNFARPWEDDAERSAVLAKMQAMARAQLGQTSAPATQPRPAPAATRRTAANSARRTAPSRYAPALPLEEEELKAYTLSYGGLPTYVYTAHTAGTGADLRYVTIVAQADAVGELKPAIQTTTDAAHLNRTPRMRLVDAVDADGSNRASLLFELRAQNSRQFSLYRVIGSRADQVFSTGSTQ